MGGERPTDQSVSSSCTHQICPFDLQPLTFFMFHFLPLSSPSSFPSPTFCPGPVSLLFLILLLPLPIPFPSNPSLAPSPFLLSPSSSPIVPLEPLSGRLYPSPLRSASASQRPVRLGIHNRPSGRDGRDASRRGALGSAAPGGPGAGEKVDAGAWGFFLFISIPLSPIFSPAYPYSPPPFAFSFLVSFCVSSLLTALFPPSPPFFHYFPVHCSQKSPLPLYTHIQSAI